MKQNPLNTMPNNEWEWFHSLKKARKHWAFQALMPLVATIWQQNFIILKKRAIWFQMSQIALFMQLW